MYSYSAAAVAYSRELESWQSSEMSLAPRWQRCNLGYWGNPYDKILFSNYFSKIAANCILCKLCNDGVQGNTEGMLPGAGPGRPGSSTSLAPCYWREGSEPRVTAETSRDPVATQDIASDSGWHTSHSWQSPPHQSREHLCALICAFSADFRSDFCFRGVCDVCDLRVMGSLCS